MSHHYHFKMSISPEEVDRAAAARGFETRSEYLRHLVRADIPRERLAATDGGNE